MANAAVEVRPKALVERVLDGAAENAVPVTWFGGGIWTVHHSGETFPSLATNPERMRRVILDTYARLATDVVYVGSGFNNFLAAALGGAIKYRKVGNPDLERPIATTPRAVRSLDLDRINVDPTIHAIYSAAGEVAASLGSRTVVSVTAWGPFTLAAQIAGVENLMRSVRRAPEFVHEVVDTAHQILLRFYSPLFGNRDLRLVSLAEPAAAGNLISREQFKSFSFAPLKDFIAWVHERGARVLLHICGNTEDRLDLVRELGADCFSVDNKVSLSAAKWAFSSEGCMAGNVDPVGVLLKGSVADVEKAARRCLEEAGRDGRFILMPGCDLPPSVPEENLRAFLESARSWSPLTP